MAEVRGTIYFADAGPGGPIKIGFTSGNLEKRLSSLRVALPTVRLVGVCAGTALDELRLHKHFAAARVRGEWFKPTPEMVKAIASGEPLNCCAGDAPPDAAPSTSASVGVKKFEMSMPLEMWEQAKAAAGAQALPLTSWMRMVVAAELRRRA